MAIMIVPMLIIILQVIPVVYLIYWGIANSKLSEYYLWARAFCLNKKKSRHKSHFQLNKEPPEKDPRIVPRRVSLEIRLEDSNFLQSKPG